MGQYRFSLWLIAGVSLFFIYSSAFAGDGEKDRLSVKGIKGIYVHVIFGSGAVKGFKNRGLKEETIKTDVELKLRMAGIKVVSRDDLNKIPGRPQLVVCYAEITVATKGSDVEDEMIAYGLTISFLQDVSLSRNTEYYPSAETWGLNWVGQTTMGDKGANYIREVIKDYTDNFINAYLSVNPKSGN